MADDPLGQAREKRGQAALARRLALGMVPGPDRQRLADYAADRDAEASALERQATVPDATSPPGAQVQQQAQQQQQAALPPHDDKDEAPTG
jgi:hypothetical protein